MVDKTKLETEKEKKREAEETDDYYRQVDKYGSKITVEDIEREESKKAKDKDDKKTDLQGRKHLFSYERQLAKYCQEGLNKIDFPEGWEYHALPTHGSDIRLYGKYFKTKIGVIVIVRTSDGDVLVRAVLTTQDPQIDMKNMDTMVVQAENTVDSAKGILLSDIPKGPKRTKSGIILP